MRCSMASPIASILHALYDEDAWPTPDCAACDSQLAAFVDRELASGDAPARFPAVVAHLAQCNRCQQAYQELRALLRLERTGELVAPPAPASFDFSYLPLRPAAMAVTSAEPKPWRLDALGRLVIEFSAELLRSLQGPALQPTMLKSDAPAGLRYELGGAVDDLIVRIEAEAQRRNPQQVTIEVEVDIPSRGGWPHLAGSTVTLRRDDGLLDQQETDAFGKAVFEDVSTDDLPQLSFTVEAPPAVDEG